MQKSLATSEGNNLKMVSFTYHEPIAHHFYTGVGIKLTLKSLTKAIGYPR